MEKNRSDGERDLEMREGERKVGIKIFGMGHLKNLVL